MSIRERWCLSKMCPKFSSLTLVKLPGSGLEGDAKEDQGKSRTGTQVFVGKGMDLVNCQFLTAAEEHRLRFTLRSGHFGANLLKYP